MDVVVPRLEHLLDVLQSVVRDDPLLAQHGYPVLHEVERQVRREDSVDHLELRGKHHAHRGQRAVGLKLDDLRQPGK